jgi:guanylate kinase
MNKLAMNKLVVISAPSGAGKTTLCNRLLKDLAGRLVLSVSSTTRAPRGAEKHGAEYHFLSQEDFKNGITQGDFAEWALVHGNYYGTSKKTIEEAFRKGVSVLLEIDVQGAASLQKAFPDRNVRIFIAPPSMEELEKRLRSRATDSEATIQHRLQNAREEMARMKEFEKIIINDDFERAYAELKEAVEKALHG